jgi:cytochrome b6-f complex subunit 5
MVEVLLSGIVLGLTSVTILGLFVAAYLQYRRGNQFNV